MLHNCQICYRYLSQYKSNINGLNDYKNTFLLNANACGVCAGKKSVTISLCCQLICRTFCEWVSLPIHAAIIHIKQHIRNKISLNCQVLFHSVDRICV